MSGYESQALGKGCRHATAKDRLVAERTANILLETEHGPSARKANKAMSPAISPISVGVGMEMIYPAEPDDWFPT